MSTRHKVDLRDKSISDLQLTFQQTKPTPVKQELSPSFSSNSSIHVLNSSPQMSADDDIRELEASRLIQLKIEEKFLSKIPPFKSSHVSDVDEFLSQANDIFEQLKYSDDIRLIKIEEKLDDSLKPWFRHMQQQVSFNWNNFQIELRNYLQSSSSLSSHILNDNKLIEFDPCSHKDLDEKPSALDLLRQDIPPFTGEGNPRLWFLKLDGKFSELRLSFEDRLELLPYFFTGETILWFSLNKAKFHCYTDFCHLFALDYLQPEHQPDHSHSSKFQNKSLPLSSSAPVIEHPRNLPLDDTNVKTQSTDLPSVLSPAFNSGNTSNSTLSPTISKALIDRFVKDPIKFYGGKDNIINWLDEIEQQFKTMNLSELDKLNLIHICLKGEAYQWYKQQKDKFISWSIFITEITKSFSSNLQRDLAFKKLQRYHQTVHQSVTQYYMEMIKLMKQADSQMNESTKVQYLMNGLRSSLSTEARRNYPTTTEEFLVQAKIAEELTAFNNMAVPDSFIGHDLSSPSSSSYSTTTDPSSTTNINNYQRHSNVANPDSYDHHLPDDSNQPRYVSRISKSSSSRSSGSNQPPSSSRQAFRDQSSSTTPQPLLNDYTYRNNNFAQQQQQQQQQQPFQRCFKCGSLDHIARHCHSFGKRNQ